MAVIIGIDPHKASHTAVAIGRDEQPLAEIKVRATCQQTDRLPGHFGQIWRVDGLVHLKGSPVRVTPDALTAE
jgi:hypothetical protein